jgi:hypothetical protein
VLRLLDLSNNPGIDLPDDLFDTATDLVWLGLQRCGMRKLPVCVTRATALVHLNVAHNALTCIPREIAYCTKLESFLCAGNDLETLPVELGSLSLLKSLWCQRNERMRTLPVHIDRRRFDHYEGPPPAAEEEVGAAARGNGVDERDVIAAARIILSAAGGEHAENAGAGADADDDDDDDAVIDVVTVVGESVTALGSAESDTILVGVADVGDDTGLADAEGAADVDADTVLVSVADAGADAGIVCAADAEVSAPRGVRPPKRRVPMHSPNVAVRRSHRLAAKRARLA